MTSQRVGPTTRIGFLGPTGTFTEQALLTQPDLASAQLQARPSFAEILFAVDDGELDLGFVAIENAIEGAVNVTMDTLAFDVQLLIQREVVLAVEMNLMARPGADLEGVKRIASFPHAHAQCRTWLRAHLPEAELVATSSTAEAAELVASGNDNAIAAVANVRAADVYGLELLARDIEDHPENSTRFALVGRQAIPPPTGHDKTSIVVFQRADEPGSLLGILHEFAARSINLTLLLSRPTKTALGDYCFILDLEGHVSDEVVADCLRTLKEKQADVKFLGSYPAGSPGGPELRRVANSSSRAASEWITSIRSRVVD